jgi:predicted PurR-regulated permease PerM
VRLQRVLKGRGKAAGLLTAALVLLTLSPIVLAVLTLLPTARSLIDEVRAAGSGKGALAALVSHGASAREGGGPTNIVDLVRTYGANASKVLGTLAGASIAAIVGAFVFCVVFYGALVDGPKLDRWLERHAPLERGVYRRCSDAFHQSGRGLLVGSGLTALVQGGIATIVYFALGVPRALLLGLLSTVAALIPMTGPTLVWVPVAAGLALTGHTVKALVLTGIGVVVVGSIDNILRPWISRRAQVGLDTTVVLVAIFGGIIAFGAWGLLLGPLAVRLAVEAMSIVREKRLFRSEGPP